MQCTSFCRLGKFAHENAGIRLALVGVVFFDFFPVPIVFVLLKETSLTQSTMNLHLLPK